jgi:hypothetical protein
MVARNGASFAVALKRGTGSSSLKAEVTAFERLHIVRGWNLLGDNGRRLAIGILALMGRTEWFCVAVLVPFNVLLALAFPERGADRLPLSRRASRAS